MKLFLDTSVLVLWIAGKPLPKSVERLLAKADTECFISIVTGWEIILKAQLGLSPQDFDVAISEMGAALMPIRFKHLNELFRLPYVQDHRDPFDRMLIAQAIAEELPIVSNDTRFPSYNRLRVIWA